MFSDCAIGAERGVMTESKKGKVPCEVYSRIVGYLRPVQNWNVGKQQEFKDRQYYKFKTERRKVIENAE